MGCGAAECNRMHETACPQNNLAGIAIADNPELHTKTKHIQAASPLLRPRVRRAAVHLGPLRQDDGQLGADFFTKPLKPKHFTAMRNAIMSL